MQSGHWMQGVAMMAVLGALVAGTIVVPGPSVVRPTPGAIPNTPTTVSVTVNILGGGMPPQWFYSPSTLTLHVYQRVQVTFFNFDTRIGPVPSPFYSYVLGPATGTELVTQYHTSYVAHELALNQISHTFTIVSGGVIVNVPIPPMLGGIPTKVVVSFVLMVPGTFSFGDVVLSNPPMPGMHGTLTVS